MSIRGPDYCGPGNDPLLLRRHERNEALFSSYENVFIFILEAGICDMQSGGVASLSPPHPVYDDCYRPLAQESGPWLFLLLQIFLNIKV